MFMNECIDSKMGPIHVCFAVLLASDDPRTSLVLPIGSKVVLSSLGATNEYNGLK
jgi:hypothetical protein